MKLHGTVGASEHFIIAEEDFRTYPMRYAAFVNLARQVFLENELCLLGFSGDDPNFLQWSGWVRDFLGESARRIFLVGALDLGPTKRKFLEARNIAPIDLMPLVRNHDRRSRHLASAQIFINFLASTRPKPAHDWMPQTSYGNGLDALNENDWRHQRDPANAGPRLDEITEIWRADRESYPGWLICPANRQMLLRHRTDSAPTLTEAALAVLPPERRAEILYELVWRHVTAFWPISSHLVPLLSSIADPSQVCGLEHWQQLEVAAALLREARESVDKPQFTRWSGVIEVNTEPGSNLHAEVAYQRALWARDELDFPGVLAAADDVWGSDPIWRIRRAALLYECGLYEEANSLVTDTLLELRERQQGARTSVWLKSRRAWVEWLAQATREGVSEHEGEIRWPLEFKEAHCDPYERLSHEDSFAQERLASHREKSRTIVPAFEPGRYTDRSQNIYFRSATTLPAETSLDRLVETVGLPVRLRHVDLLGSAATAVLEVTQERTMAWYVRLLRTVHSPSDALFRKYLGRVAVAQIPASVAQAIVERIKESIGYWRDRLLTRRNSSTEEVVDTLAVERLRLLIEALARLVARQSGPEAIDCFKLAVDLAKDPALRNVWVSEELGHLARYSAASVPRAERTALVLPALEYPLTLERGGGPHFRWPAFMTLFENTRAIRTDSSETWRERIAALTTAVSGEESRAEALLRLMYLCREGVLTDAERANLGMTLWSQSDGLEPPLPSKTRLLPHAFLYLPAPGGVDVALTVKRRLFEESCADHCTDFFLAIAAAALPGSGAGMPILPTRDQAIRLFDAVTAWRPTKPLASSDLELGIKVHSSQQNSDELINLMGQALPFL